MRKREKENPRDLTQKLDLREYETALERETKEVLGLQTHQKKTWRGAGGGLQLNCQNSHGETQKNGRKRAIEGGESVHQMRGRRGMEA